MLNWTSIEDSRKTIDEVRDMIRKRHTRLAIVSGMTCSGKTTFSRSLKKIGYEHIELDIYVRQEVGKRYSEESPEKAFCVYSGNAPMTWQKSFERGATTLIENSLKKSRVVVDCAIGECAVYKKIYYGKLKDFLCVYLHPFEQDFYLECITERLLEDLENGTKRIDFWDRISVEKIRDLINNDLEKSKFKKIVFNYCREKIAESKRRYCLFKLYFNDIVITTNKRSTEF